MQVINKWVNHHGWVKDEFNFSSLAINKNFASRLHRDVNNMGPSVIVACGDYKGGCLKYFPTDDGKSSLELINDKDGVTVYINCKPFLR